MSEVGKSERMRLIDGMANDFFVLMTKMTLSMKKIKITLVKSPIDRPERQKLTLKALGLKKTNSTKEVEATPQILGMVRKVEHMLKVEFRRPWPAPRSCCGAPSACASGAGSSQSTAPRTSAPAAACWSGWTAASRTRWRPGRPGHRLRK